MNRPRIVFGTNVYSPFQVDVADAIQAQGELDYHVCFFKGTRSERPAHWFHSMSEATYVHYNTRNEDSAVWLYRKLEQLKPEVIICGFYRGPLLRAVRRFIRRSDALVAMWNEPPLPRSALKSWVRSAVYQYNLRDFDFAMAIGDRAHKIYGSVFSECDTYLVPYGQDLTHHFAVKRTPACHRSLRFLFSGRLIPQHNIRTMVDALATVAKKRPGSFTFTIAGYGPEEDYLNAMKSRVREFGEAIVYDRDYERWEDRVRPFQNCDVLLYPSHHAGWGLVVPEAMASAMTVIASYGVESARYYITPGLDGLIIDTSRRSIVSAVEWCLDHKDALSAMGEAARSSAVRGTAEVIGRQVCAVVKTNLQCRNERKRRLSSLLGTL